MKNRLSGYVSTWPKEVGIEIPTPPTEDEVNKAMREIADFPTTFGIIEDFFDALSVINRIPDKTEAHVQILDRYMPLAYKLQADAQQLIDRMREDYERTKMTKDEMPPDEEGDTA